MKLVGVGGGDSRLGPRTAAGACRTLLTGAAALALTMGAALAVQAQTFVSPFLGRDFGADTGCLNLLVCADRKVDMGVAAGRMVGMLGFEEDVAYAKDFFGAAPNLSSSVLTVMSNGLVTRRIGRWYPYAVGGLGLMKTRIQFTQASFYATDRANLAWDLGAGLGTVFGRRWGVRVDARYVSSFRDVPLSGFTVSESKLGFGRVSVGLLVRF
jgi:hypothetical protein